MSTIPSTASRLRLLFVGDTSFGENYHARDEKRGRANRLLTRGYEDTMVGVSDLLGSADFVIANLETPLTAPKDSPFEGRKRYIHWGDPRRTTSVLGRHGIGAVSLGNNHVCDYGDDGLRSSLDALDGAGITPFGAGLRGSEAAAPFTGSFTLGDADLRLAVFGGKQRRQSSKKDIQPYAGSAPGVHRCREEDAVRIHAMREADPGRLIVAFPHWGKNYGWSAPRQARLAHALIDAGADLVLGHGSHMMGEIERHRDRWIVYSLGNFVFGSRGRYQKVEGAVPFSFAAAIDACRDGAAGLALSLRLYPICTDNRATDYRTRVVTPDEMNVVQETLRERGEAAVLDAWTLGRDSIGPYLEASMAKLTDLVATRTPTRLVHVG